MDCIIFLEFFSNRDRGRAKDFTEVTDSDIIAIQERLNNRPRKALGYATPHEAFNELLKNTC